MNDDKTRIEQRFANAGVGTQLSGIYELDERIASGGMGEVYRGHNIQTGDSVAIKIVLPEYANDQTILALFQKEASILNHLSHEAVVRYHVFTKDPGIGRTYLAMEFVNGESLFDVMKRGPMPTPDACRLCHRLTSGLSAVHEAGAIHRDLSPDNIILPGGRVDRAKIIDFGIARSETVGGGTLIDGRFAGKYNYVSPEQLGLFGGQVSPQSDIYSLGLVLAAALRGRPIDMSGSQAEVVEKRRKVPDLSDIDLEFRPLLDSMLQPLPANRPESMAEIARMTRDGVVDAKGTRAPVRRNAWDVADERRAEPVPEPASGPPAPNPPGFVEHVRPGYLSTSRPQASASPSSRVEAKPRPAGRSTGLVVTAAASLVLVAGAAGAYFGGFVDFGNRKPAEASAPAALTPAPDKPAPDKPAAEKPSAEPLPQQSASTEAKPAVAQTETKPQATAETTKPAETETAAAQQPPAETTIKPAETAAKPGDVALPPETTAKAEEPAQAAAADAGAAPPADTAPAPAEGTAASRLANALAKMAEDDAARKAASAGKAETQTTQTTPPKSQAVADQQASDDAAAGNQAAQQPQPKPVVAQPPAKQKPAEQDLTEEKPVGEKPPEQATVAQAPALADEAPPAKTEITAEKPAQTAQPATKEPTAEALPQTQEAAEAKPSAEADQRQPAADASREPPAQDDAVQQTPDVAAQEAARQPPDETAAPAQSTAVEGAQGAAASDQPAVAEPKPSEQTVVTQDAQANAQPAADAAAATEPQETVAMNVPQPELPSGVVAQRVSWVDSYSGGNCFFASAIAATDSSIEIEGFGTAVDPFAQLETAFQDRFRLEPDIDVRLIEPDQCEVTRFLETLGKSRADKPTLQLDRTSIPDGSALSGVLRTNPGLKSSLILIDNKGMMFSLDDRVVVAANQASFNIPIGLGASEKGAGKGVPQIVLVVTGPEALDAAEFPAPVRADEALPKILAEIRQKGGDFSATAKYFRLGG